MCSECRKQYCHDLCPNAEDTRSATCPDCGEELYGKAVYAAADGNIYCLSCVEGMDTEEVLRICGFSSLQELLTRLEENTERKSGAIFIFE